MGHPVIDDNKLKNYESLKFSSFCDLNDEVVGRFREACRVLVRVELVAGRGLEPQPPHEADEEDEELGAGERLPQTHPLAVAERHEVLGLAEPAAGVQEPS